MTHIAVLGGTGFVGSAVVEWLASQPETAVTIVPAPRARSDSRRPGRLLAEAEVLAPALAVRLRDIDVVVNAAGDPDASATDLGRLIGANALVPAVCALAAGVAGVHRLVHVSSAVVQGRAKVLDESETRDPFSPYALSKCLGERAVLAAPAPAEVVVYRPPSVHAPDRRVTRRVARIAGSALCCVAGDGARPSPQALLGNVAAAIGFLCLAPAPPRVVTHPWEGVTTGSLMEIFGGGRRPHRVPEPAAALALALARAAMGWSPRRRADLRRIETLWFGQRQAASSLTALGWTPPIGADGWRSLADQVAAARKGRPDGGH